jgi:nicotinate-nucleotide adenylyltransferase
MTAASRGIRLGVLGGTLDPIHCGHVDAALAARDALGLARVIIVPSHVPPHRPVRPAASPFHRFAMAALAVNGVAGLSVSDDELLAPGPSYTANTLERLHAQGWTALQIFFVIGADAFAEIATWHRYPEVLDLAHFVVISRPGHTIDAATRRLPELAGRIRPVGEAQATAPPSIFLVEASTPDISSTTVRDRIRRGEPIGGLVPAAVEAHIQQHSLYQASTADQLHGED